MLKLRILAPPLVALSLLVVATPALAMGGKAIASAPTVAFGQQEFGNTATDGASANPTNVFGGCDNSPNYESLWNLPVTSGDRITIDYEGDLAGLFLFPVGTNDFNVSQASHTESDAGSNQKGQDAFAAPQTGAMPLEFFAGCATTGPGPYDFTAFVTHALVVALRSPSANRQQHRTFLSVSAHNPDGVSITQGLQEHIQGQNSKHQWTPWNWTAIRPFNFYLNWPPAMRGKIWTVRTVVSGPGYVTATSPSIRIKAL